MNFELRFSITVDRPELRGPTYPVVAAGHIIHSAWNYASQADAVRMFEAILGGECDFGSEYVSKISVVQMREGQSPRRVRKQVIRNPRQGAIQ